MSAKRSLNLIVLLNVSCSVLSILYQFTPSDKVQLTASPKTIQDDTIPLTITCKFTPSDHPEMTKLLSLKMSKRSFDSAEFVDLATLTKSQLKDEDDFFGTATGQLVNDGGTSELKVMYARPSTDQAAGEYKCQAAGLDSDDIIVGSEQSLTINWPTQNASVVLACMDGAPRESLTVLKRSLRKCGAPDNQWFQLARDLTEKQLSNNLKINGVSDVSHSNSFYIFTVRAIPFNDAVKICRDNNGYLAEINTKQEFLFLKQAVSTLRDRTGFIFDYLLTGASFDEPYGDFHFLTHPGAPMYTGYWDRNEPHKNDMAYNWLMLRVKGGDFLMCDGIKHSFDLAYLCEISNDI